MEVFRIFRGIILLAFATELLCSCSIEASLEQLIPQTFNTPEETPTKVSTARATGTVFVSKSASGDGRYIVKSAVGPMVSHSKVRSGIYDVDLN